MISSYYKHLTDITMHFRWGGGVKFSPRCPVHRGCESVTALSYRAELVGKILLKCFVVRICWFLKIEKFYRDHLILIKFRLSLGTPWVPANFPTWLLGSLLDRWMGSREPGSPCMQLLSSSSTARASMVHTSGAVHQAECPGAGDPLPLPRELWNFGVSFQIRTKLYFGISKSFAKWNYLCLHCFSLWRHPVLSPVSVKMEAVT